MIESAINTSLLALQLRERIRREGPISFRDWMEAALYDPTYGYYCRKDLKRWGRDGDYRTSPEISPLFSATLARYFAKLYDKLGQPKTWTILEVGAGEGHFAAGVLKTLQEFYPNVFAATCYVIDELGGASRALDRLAEFQDRVRCGAISQVGIDPGVVFTNELLDAFPVHRITFRGEKFREVCVDVNSAGDFEWTLSELPAELLPRVEACLAASAIKLGDGETVEVCLDAEDWWQTIATQVHNGYVVTVDYGFAESNSAGRETLRGFKRHQFVDDLLSEPGEHDLTTSVNWGFVKSIGTQLGLKTVEFERQDRFLLSTGLLEQLELESDKCTSEAERLRLTTSAREMILPDGMAAHFQVLVQRKTSTQ
ncbi:MAG TPA: SAM-dependent methyltransferase [Pyrinomonadaceae bacterium]|nr:SAM-dependent methyltransferase [Pyrinomonadaceae bacterium]